MIFNYNEILKNLKNSNINYYRRDVYPNHILIFKFDNFIIGSVKPRKLIIFTVRKQNKSLIYTI